MFEDKKIFVTGGTGSIGNSICHYFKQNKCSEIYASTTNLEKVNKKDDFITFKQLNLDEISKINLDEQLDFDTDFLVLNAGVTKDNIFLRMSADEWSNVIDVNLNSSFYLLKHFIKKMVKKDLVELFLFLLWLLTLETQAKLTIPPQKQLYQGW